MLAVVLIFAQDRDPSSTLLQKPTLTCRDWAVVANEYVALGEARAIARLKAAEAGRPDPFSTASTRKGLLCRILFVPRRGGALRPPMFGGLALPYRSMPASRWPEYPFAVQSGAWFLLSEAYELGGKAEPTADYVDYCRKAGSFRTIPLPVPTSEEAEKVLDAALRSPRWKALRWSFTSLRETYEISPEPVVENLRRQTKF